MARAPSRTWRHGECCMSTTLHSRDMGHVLRSCRPPRRLCLHTRSRAPRLRVCDAVRAISCENACRNSAKRDVGPSSRPGTAPHKRDGCGRFVEYRAGKPIHPCRDRPEERGDCSGRQLAWRIHPGRGRAVLGKQRPELAVPERRRAEQHSSERRMAALGRQRLATDTRRPGRQAVLPAAQSASAAGRTYDAAAACSRSRSR